MKILIITIKSTAVLDFVLPMCWQLSDSESEHQFSLLYCMLNKGKILRKSKYYKNTFKQLAIPQLDLTDFLSFPANLLKLIFKPLFRKTIFDTSTFDKTLSKIRYGSILANKVRHFKENIETSLHKQVDYTKIFSELNPDLVLLDNTCLKDLSGSRELHKALQQSKIKVILLPHAPHHSTTKAFTPFTPYDPLPSFCEYWMPFKYEKSWTSHPKKKNQFHYVGYPGLDSRWLTHIMPAKNNSATKKLKCLLIVRKFLPPGVRSREDEFIYEHKEFISLIESVAKVLNSTGKNIHVIIKPHPSNDFKTLSKVLTATSLTNWSLSGESIYHLMPELDFIISLYSTILLVPAMAGLPTILLQSTKQQQSHQDPHFKQLYTNLSYYSKDLHALQKNVNEIVKLLSQRSPTLAKITTKDKQHIRKFFPDKSVELCKKRL